MKAEPKLTTILAEPKEEQLKRTTDRKRSVMSNTHVLGGEDRRGRRENEVGMVVTRAPSIKDLIIIMGFM